MGKISIKDLPTDHTVSKEEMRKVLGGGIVVEDFVSLGSRFTLLSRTSYRPFLKFSSQDPNEEVQM